MHVVNRRQLHDFLELIPDWEILSHRLEKIVLERGMANLDGFHQFFLRERTGAIYLCAWKQELWTTVQRWYFDEHRHHFELLGLSYDLDQESVTCRFTISQARAFTLLHVFLHELGHHYDRIRRRSAKAKLEEDFAERFANRRFDQLLPLYRARFGDPRRQSESMR